MNISPFRRSPYQRNKVCQVCNREQSINLNGNFRKHPNPHSSAFDNTCTGSGRTSSTSNGISSSLSVRSNRSTRRNNQSAQPLNQSSTNNQINQPTNRSRNNNRNNNNTNQINQSHSSTNNVRQTVIIIIEIIIIIIIIIVTTTMQKIQFRSKSHSLKLELKIDTRIMHVSNGLWKKLVPYLPP